ncbi:hypothetical protein ACH4OX_05665 [Streptomyces roseolus]|uniref:hypothetical protein n=1 Tax=Streptomyces roseolus TaxID=67358 RepID=UPI0037B4B11C
MMRKHHKIASLAATAVMLGSGLTAAAAGTATASASVFGAARACTADAPSFTSYAGTGSNDPSYYPARGTWLTTTTRCNDINLKLNATRSVRTCFKSGTGWNCNSWRSLTAGRWGTAATDVLDGTQFFLQFSGTARVSGQIDY